MFGKQWKYYRATGFGVVVASRDGELLGYGLGNAPGWCSTAASAEAWALQVVLSQCPFPPQMRTDCLSLLKTAEHGAASATASSRMLARIWSLMASHLDGDIASLVGSGNLVWMPAHQTLAMVGEKKLSNGARLSNVDWRANRLVDALAKMAAGMFVAPPEVTRALDSATEAVKHAAMRLGSVTHAANNHTTTITDDSGNIVKRVLRDAEPAPKRRMTTSRPCIALPSSSSAAVAATATRTEVCVKPWTPVARQRSCRVRKRSHGASVEAANLRRRVDEIGSCLRVTSARLTAFERIQLLTERVRARSHLA